MQLFKLLGADFLANAGLQRPFTQPIIPPPPSRKDFKYFILKFSSLKLAWRAVQATKRCFWLTQEAVSSAEERHGQGFICRDGAWRAQEERSLSPCLGQRFSIQGT